MFTPKRFESPAKSLRRSRRLLRVTKAIEGIREPVSRFESAMVSLDERYSEWKESRHRLSIAIEAQRVAKRSLNHELRAVGLAILAVGDGRRGFEVYRTYFPEGYGRALRMSGQESLGVAAGILAGMEEETSPDILARRDALQSASARLESATTAREAAVDAKGQAKAHLEAEKLAWRKAYCGIYFTLCATYSDNRSFVASLFRAGTDRKANEDEEPVAVQETVNQAA